MRTVRFTEVAEQELIDRLNHIFRQNPLAASNLYDRIEQALLKTSIYPEIHRRSRYQKNRELFVGPLVLIYSVGEDDIQVRHVFRQEEDWQNKSDKSDESDKSGKNK
jgi:plasmid stabilization system protein ParE